MTDPRETLARIRAQVSAASPGPWFDEERNLDKPWDLTTVYYGFHNGETPDRDLVAEASYDNAAFIAAARTTVPALLYALEKVLELHQPVTDGMGFTEHGYGGISPACSSCGTSDEYAVPYPCPTVTAITTALEATK